MGQDVTIVFGAPSSTALNALPPASAISTFETNAKTYGQDHIDTPLTSGSSVYNDEHSVLYYDGCTTWYKMSEYFASSDATFSSESLTLSNHLWDEYVDVYGTIDGSDDSDGYRKLSQWVFAESAERKSAAHLEDMTEQSAYSAYLNGHIDMLEYESGVSNGGDLRGAGYLLDAYCRYKRTTGNDITAFSRNQLEDCATKVETYCNTIGDTAQTFRAFELYYMAGMTGLFLMKNRDILDTYIDTYATAKKCVDFIVSGCEVINTDEYRLPYGVGYIDDGGGGNETTAYYAGLEMIAVAPFKYFPQYQAYADGLFEYSVGNVALGQDKDYAQQYRFGLEYLMGR